jgi:hypothetical protein
MSGIEKDTRIVRQRAAAIKRFSVDAECPVSKHGGK